MKKKFYLWVGIFLLVCLAIACGKEETRTETVDAGNFDVNILRNEFLNGVFEDDVNEEQEESSLEDLEEEKKFQEQSKYYRELLQEYEYFISNDSYIDRIEEKNFYSKRYYVIRIVVDYIDCPKEKYKHKEDYVFFYDKNTEELFQLFYFKVEEHKTEISNDFNDYFHYELEDINFDGEKDLIISVGEFEDEEFWAYLWTEEGFQYEETFDLKGYYRVEEERVVCIQNVPEGTIESYYCYQQGEFKKYYIIKKVFGKVEDRKVEELIYKETLDCSQPKRKVCQYQNIRELLQEYGYSVEDDSFIEDITELETDNYYGVRIWIDYLEQPKSSYKHKEDYFFLYEKESKELFQILYFNVKDYHIGMACGFEEHFADITFDGKEDLLISMGGGASQHYQAYVWTEEGFQHDETFRIGSYKLDEETKTIIGFEKSGAAGIIYSYYRYEENRFISYRYERTEIIEYRGQDYKIIEIEDEDTETILYIRPDFRMEVQRLEKREKRYGQMGSVYEIRLYPSETSQEIIQSFQVVAEEELKVSLEDLNHDDYVDLVLCWKEEQDTKNKHYDIFFWKDNKFETESYIEDFIYGYLGTCEVSFFPEKLYLKKRYDTYEELTEETLFYFQEDGEYVPIRSIFYRKGSYIHVTIIDYLEGEGKILYDERVTGEELENGKIRDIFLAEE